METAGLSNGFYQFRANFRADFWTNLQANFYAGLPYSPHSSSNAAKSKHRWLSCVCSPSANGQHIVPFHLLNVRKALPFCPHRHIAIYSGKYVVSPSFPICVYPVLRKITNLFCRFLRKIKILSEDVPVKRAPLASRAGLCLQALLLTDFAESALHLR